jgi:hypothetical protein
LITSYRPVVSALLERGVFAETSADLCRLAASGARLRDAGDSAFQTIIVLARDDDDRHG